MVSNYHYISIPQQAYPEGMNAALGRNVKKLRTEQHFSISALSFITQICRPLLKRIEKGEADVRLSYVERLAAALCVDPLQLLEP